MKTIKFREDNVAIAEHQEEFQTLYAHHNPLEGSMTYCFELTLGDLQKISENGGKIYFKQLTANQPLQTIYATPHIEEVIPEEIEVVGAEEVKPTLAEEMDNVNEAGRVLGKAVKGAIKESINKFKGGNTSDNI